MTPQWITVLASLGGVGGLGTLLALFVVPASKRYEKTQEEIKQMKAEIKQLRKSDNINRSVILLLIDREGQLIQRVLEKDPDFKMEPMSDLLKRLNISFAEIVGFDKEPEADDAK